MEEIYFTSRIAGGKQINKEKLMKPKIQNKINSTNLETITELLKMKGKLLDLEDRKEHTDFHNTSFVDPCQRKKFIKK